MCVKSASEPGETPQPGVSQATRVHSSDMPSSGLAPPSTLTSSEDGSGCGATARRASVGPDLECDRPWSVTGRCVRVRCSTNPCIVTVACAVDLNVPTSLRYHGVPEHGLTFSRGFVECGTYREGRKSRGAKTSLSVIPSGRAARRNRPTRLRRRDPIRSQRPGDLVSTRSCPVSADAGICWWSRDCCGRAVRRRRG